MERTSHAQISRPAAAGAVAETVAGSRLTTTTWWVLVGAAGALLYATVLAGLVRQWYVDPATAHGVLLGIAAALVMRRRLSCVSARPMEPHRGGLLVVGLAMLVYMVGTFGAELFLVRLSLPVALAGVILALSGSRYLRAMLAPLGLVVLALPLPAVVVTNLTLSLQLIASQIAAAFLQMSGVDVIRHGNLLVLHAVTLDVVDACSGLRSAQSLVAIAAVCAAVVPLSRTRGLLLLMLVIPVAVVGNGVRIAVTGLLATWFGDIAVRGAWHDLTGYLAFLGMCAVTAGFIMLTRSHRHASQHGAHPKASA